MTEVQVVTPFATHQRLSVLIHGLAKRGKSTLAATAPKPLLVLDAEGSWRFIPGRVVYWDPMAETPPVYDGTWDITVVHVQQWTTVERVYQYLTQWPLPYVSVVLDSITEIQRRCKSNLKGSDVMKIQDWGVLLAVMDATIRGFRDLCLISKLAVRCVVFVSETQETMSGRFIPSMQGQIARSLPYWVDICTYLYLDYELDTNGQPTLEVRKAWMGPHPNYETGERVQGRLGQFQTVYKPPDGQTGTDIDRWMHTTFSTAMQPNSVAVAPGSIAPVTESLSTPINATKTDSAIPAGFTAESWGMVPDQTKQLILARK